MMNRREKVRFIMNFNRALAKKKNSLNAQPCISFNPDLIIMTMMLCTSGFHDAHPPSTC